MKQTFKFIYEIKVKNDIKISDGVKTWIELSPLRDGIVLANFDEESKKYSFLNCDIEKYTFLYFSKTSAVCKATTKKIHNIDEFFEYTDF
jgi:hypothetical protein